MAHLLTKHGLRKTGARIMALQILKNKKTPLDAMTLMFLLSDVGVKVNKTTVFRMLDEFYKKKLVMKYEFGEGKYRYEFADIPHHHHAICTNCTKIEEIDNCAGIDKTILEYLDKKGFMPTYHTFDFYGVCINCSKTKKVQTS